MEAALLVLYRRWTELPISPGYSWRYYATRFLQTIVPRYKNYKGGVRAVRDVLGQPTIGPGRLSNYPHLTVEHLVLSGAWDDLFNETDRQLARVGLKSLKQ